MYRQIAVLLSLVALNSVDALSLKKAAEGALPSFCIFGICVSDKKEYDQSTKIHNTRDQAIEDLTKKTEEMDAWKREDEERKKLEEEEVRAKQQEAKDAVIAQQCTCTWACGDRNDGTICFRKCCNNEFGGNPNGVAPPAGTAGGGFPGAAAVPGTAPGGFPGLPALPAFPGFAIPAAPVAPVAPVAAAPVAPAALPKAPALPNPFQPWLNAAHDIASNPTGGGVRR